MWEFRPVKLEIPVSDIPSYTKFKWVCFIFWLPRTEQGEDDGRVAAASRQWQGFQKDTTTLLKLLTTASKRMSQARDAVGFCLFWQRKMLTLLYFSWFPLAVDWYCGACWSYGVATERKCTDDTSLREYPCQNLLISSFHAVYYDLNLILCAVVRCWEDICRSGFDPSIRPDAPPCVCALEPA